MVETEITGDGRRKRRSGGGRRNWDSSNVGRNKGSNLAAPTETGAVVVVEGTLAETEVSAG